MNIKDILWLVAKHTLDRHEKCKAIPRIFFVFVKLVYFYTNHSGPHDRDGLGKNETWTSAMVYWPQARHLQRC
jgi:hypothetical protein